FCSLYAYSGFIRSGARSEFTKILLSPKFLEKQEVLKYPLNKSGRTTSSRRILRYLRSVTLAIYTNSIKLRYTSNILQGRIALTLVPR
ncbi:MAG: hypothetical protein PUP93_17800, partial [Rhizonema sp. NSF051]|nr:hypothetical protein [Rhizonema sp. NSF051]